MMKNLYVFVFVFLFLIASHCLFAQHTQLYMPLNIKQAYTNNTRAYDGHPGSEYWQNKANYKIQVHIDPQNGLLTGSEEIHYFNDSPDSLYKLVIHLFPNIYKKGNSREFVIDQGDATEGVRLNGIVLNDKKLDLQGKNYQVEYIHNDVQLHLDEPLPAGKSIRLTISWQYNINRKSHMRTGMVDASSYFIAYFFPRIAVYDDIDGWNIHKYSGIAEFYNDFGSFDVSVSVPKDFLVWSTGTLQNAEEVLSDNYYQRFMMAQTSDSIIHIIDSTESALGNITTPNEKNTWHFKAENVSDVAFAVSDHYLWDATSLIVDKESGKRVLIESAYNKNSKDFYDVATISRQSIDYLSNVFPGIPFPFPNLTVFNGLDEMEYPMMVNDKSVYSKSYLIKLTSHEISHSYFPFYMGINETKYGWMDEGWACFFEYQICEVLDSRENANIFYMDRYKELQGYDLDLPIFSPSIYLKRPVYHINTYAKAATFLFILRSQLGEELFKSVLHEFIKRWNGKHPTPYDFFFTLSDFSGQRLDWLIQPWIFEFGYIDLAIKSVREIEHGYEITIEKKGKYPAPLNLLITYEDESSERISKSVSIWSNLETLYKMKLAAEKKIQLVELVDPLIPDADNSNNYFEVE